jgi:uncharacterized damage-inducible protein DinB
MHNELTYFMDQWDHETNGTTALMRVLPSGQYDFRPDAEGRSIGELAWHLAEVDAYVSLGIVSGNFRFEVKPPHIERPKTLEGLAPAFRVVHDDAVARVSQLTVADLDRQIPYADGTLWTIRDLFWRKLLLHAVHHRGQLMLLSRLAGGIPPELFGRTRERSVLVQAGNAH